LKACSSAVIDILLIVFLEPLSTWLGQLMAVAWFPPLFLVLLPGEGLLGRRDSIPGTYWRIERLVRGMPAYGLRHLRSAPAPTGSSGHAACCTWWLEGYASARLE
jgi:hypothetical protein